jgi:hypothetical protein
LFAGWVVGPAGSALELDELDRAALVLVEALVYLDRDRSDAVQGVGGELAVLERAWGVGRELALEAGDDVRGRRGAGEVEDEAVALGLFGHGAPPR